MNADGKTVVAVTGKWGWHSFYVFCATRWIKQGRESLKSKEAGFGKHGTKESVAFDGRFGLVGDTDFLFVFDSDILLQDGTSSSPSPAHQ